MNKTINVNIGGLFFYIDEIAYQKLERYLDAVAKSLYNEQGKTEILSDIEARISELLSEKITHPRQVINDKDIQAVILVMGQPEDYAEAEKNGKTPSEDSSHGEKKIHRKLFRNPDDKFLGGVCSGIACFFGIDSLWIRLIFLLLIASGTSFILYIVLWILVPNAETTAEKLQMEGNAVTVDNIEKKIREEFDHISAKVKAEADELGQKISNIKYSKIQAVFDKLLKVVSNILLACFKIIEKFVGVLLVFIAAVMVIALLFSFLIGIFKSGFVSYPPFFFYSIIPKNILLLFLIVAMGIPFLFLFPLGLRILSSRFYFFSKTTVLSLLGIWLIALMVLGFSFAEYYLLLN